MTFTAAQLSTLNAEINLSWHTGQYDIKSMKATTKIFFLDLNHPWWAEPPGCPKFFFIKNAFDFENLIFTLYCTACVCNKASIIEPTSNDFLACWKFITLRKLTQLSLLFKVIKHLEYTFWANLYSLMFCLSRFKSICGNQSPNY